jgi:hypothetical protein
MVEDGLDRLTSGRLPRGGLVGVDPFAREALTQPARNTLSGPRRLDPHPGQRVLVHADGDVSHHTNFVIHELRVKPHRLDGRIGGSRGGSSIRRETVA